MTAWFVQKPPGHRQALAQKQTAPRPEKLSENITDVRLSARRAGLGEGGEELGGGDAALGCQGRATEGTGRPDRGAAACVGHWKANASGR